MPLIAIALVLAVVVGIVVRAGDDDGPTAATRASSGRRVDQLPVLLVHRGPTGNDLIAVADREGDRGSVILVPVATQLDVPSQGVSTLADIPTADGGARGANAVENVVGVDVGSTVLVDDAGLTALLGPAAPVTATLADSVAFPDRPAHYRSGEQQLSAAQASELMSAPQSVNELDRLVTVGAVLGGWLDRLKDPGVARATTKLQPALAPLVAIADAPDRRIDTLPVESIATGGGERFNVRLQDLIASVRDAFPKALLGPRGIRPRVEILNGTGALGVAQATADKVVPAGGRVTLTDNVPGFGLGTTQVVYYSDAWRAAAQRILDAMGCGSLRKAGQDVRIADVTILVGSDCPAYGAPGGGI
jgi:hypothetical protein